METKTIPSEGIRHIHIDRVAGDARVQGALDATTITVTLTSGEISGTLYEIDGETIRFQGGAVERAILPADMHLSISSADGDLRAQAVAGQVEIGEVRGDVRLKDLGGRVQIGQVDGNLRADNVAGLSVKQGCQGDLRAQKVANLVVGTVSGDAQVYQAGTAHLGQVNGDLRAEMLAGPLEVTRLGGDVHLNEIAGLVAIDHVSGDLHATALTGGLAAPDVAGGVSLRGPFGTEANHNVTAGGGLVLHLLPEADLHLTIQAAGRIRSDVQLTPAPDGSATFTATLGRGTARIGMRCGGDLRIIQAGSEPTGDETTFGEEDLGQRVHQQFRASFSGDWSDLGEHIRQQVQASLAAAGLDPESGQFPFERGPRPGRSGRHAPPRPAPPERPTRAAPPPPSPGPTEAEQMAILKMLEAGTISAAEAEMLLKALGANG